MLEDGRIILWSLTSGKMWTKGLRLDRDTVSWLGCWGPSY